MVCRKLVIGVVEMVIKTWLEREKERRNKDIELKISGPKST